MERRRVIPCPENQTGCKYKDGPEGCHLSEHHIFPQRTAETRLQRNFGNLAINKVLTCRHIHDLLDTFPPPDYPAPDSMRRALERGKDG